jgi:hypothetical protein
MTLDYDFLGELPLQNLPSMPAMVESTDGTDEIPIDPQITLPYDSIQAIRERDLAFTTESLPVGIAKIPVDAECLEAYRSMASFCVRTLEDYQFLTFHNPASGVHINMLEV